MYMLRVTMIRSYNNYSANAHDAMLGTGRIHHFDSSTMQNQHSH